MRTDVILMILTLLMTELTVIGRKENVKGKSNQGLNAFAFLRLVILLLESENLVEDFLYHVFFLLWIYHWLILA